MKATALLRVFSWLMWRDILSLRKNLPNKLIDGTIWSFTTITISSYILPAFGISRDYGLLIWVGTIFTVSFFESGYAAQELASDRASNYHVGYLLTLPVPSWLVFVKLAFAITLNCMALGIFMVPLGKLILQDHLSFASLNIVKFTLMFIVINVFCGFFGLWVFSWAKNTARFSEVWRRVFNPLWSFGGYQFSWYVFYSKFPRFALVTLLNPLTYAFEGLRASILGQAGFIPFWYSFFALCGFTILFAYWATRWLKQRLDCI